MICSFCLERIPTEDVATIEEKMNLYLNDGLMRCKKCYKCFQCAQCYSLQSDDENLGTEYDSDGEPCGYELPEFCSQTCSSEFTKTEDEKDKHRKCNRCKKKFILISNPYVLQSRLSLCAKCYDSAIKFIEGKE